MTALDKALSRQPTEMEKRALAAEDLIEHLENAYAQLAIKHGQALGVISDLRREIADLKRQPARPDAGTATSPAKEG